MIESIRNPAVAEVADPVALIIMEGATGPEYTEPLKEGIERELALYGIRSRVTILTGAEFDANAAMRTATRGCKGAVIIVPAGGVMYGGTILQQQYVIDAYLIKNVETGEGVKMWHAKAHTHGSVTPRLRKFATELMHRLVQERVVKPTRVYPRK